jgi:hypothetical protein
MFKRGLLQTCLAIALLTASLLWLAQVDGEQSHPQRFIGQGYAPIVKAIKREAANYPQEPSCPENRDSALCGVDPTSDREDSWEIVLADDKVMGGRRRTGVDRTSTG